MNRDFDFLFFPPFPLPKQVICLWRSYENCYGCRRISGQKFSQASSFQAKAKLKGFSFNPRVIVSVNSKQLT